MKAVTTKLDGVVCLEPKVFGDERGFFFESFNRETFQKATGTSPDFVQDNHSRSARNVLRGLHYQVDPHAQGKLVRVVSGAIFDVAVDIRRSSPTFGQWIGETLSAENRAQLWIPRGFAHGFLALTDGAEIAYKASAYWAPESERTIAWNDPDLAIDWPLTAEPILSGKDLEGRPFAGADVFD